MTATMPKTIGQAIHYLGDFFDFYGLCFLGDESQPD